MASVSFRLRGKDYVLDKDEVEERLHGVAPKTTKKYYVRIRERPYPPKQVLEAALDLHRLDFTTLDANRVLTKLGFRVLGRKEEEAEKPESETLFETYLSSRGLIEFEFEPTLPGTLKRPDYKLRIGKSDVLFEVKEFRAKPGDFGLGVGVYDPFRPIREKIEAARKKFKDLERLHCCLVLYNNGKPLVDLGWRFIYGSMLGNLGVRIPIDPERGAIEEKTEQVFLEGGKMYKYRNERPVEPRNTTISAILVLQLLNVGEKRFSAEIRWKERLAGEKLGVEKFWAEIERAKGTERDISSLRELRMVVHQNPYARRPIEKEFWKVFLGKYDEIYGPDQERRITRLFAGEGIRELEELEEGNAESGDWTCPQK